MAGSDPRRTPSKVHRGEDLRKHDFAHQELTGADFGEADLQEADFTGAVLANAQLCKANLEGACIEAAVLWGADLFEAKAKSLEQTLELRRGELRERSGSLRTIVLAALSFLIYTAISIFTSKDEVVLSNTGTMEVPVLDAKVSPHAFFVSSCVVGFGLIAYVQLQMVSFAALLARMPARFPDGYRPHLPDLSGASLRGLRTTSIYCERRPRS